MVRVREFAPAKVNLALHILGRRADGFHELDSIVAFANVGDVLDLERAEKTELTVEGAFANAVPATLENLVLKAHSALAAKIDVPHVRMRLTKNLPVASGIGGGSADAAAALRGILQLADLTVESGTLRQIALSLGADVPVCLFGKACRMQGVGDVISPLQHQPATAILLVNPLQACGTADVFRTLALRPGDAHNTALDVDAPQTWRNDLTGAACVNLPIIAEVLQTLHLHAGADVVRMSGSGATCFALYGSLAEAQDAARVLQEMRSTWWVAAALLS